MTRALYLRVLPPDSARSRPVLMVETFIRKAQ